MRLWSRTDSSRIGMKVYIAVFCVTVIVALGLLVAAAFLPQYLIQGHVVDSVDLVFADVANNYLFDRSEASKMDVVTDIMMLRTSLSTNDRYLGSVLTNPVYGYEGLTEWVDVDELLANQAYDMPADDVWFYSRYWMGFRVVLRLALTFLTYAQIKRYLAFIFFTLFVAVICSLAKQTDSKIAFLFALSVVLIRPHIMATSMQYTCCFLIAFAAMFLVPRIHAREKYESLFFMEIGMLTMYFDFYTVPLITAGFPLMYLCILKQKTEHRVSFRMMFRNLAAWFAGYGLMWIAKLVLTTVLTSENALKQGLQSFAGRVGIRKDAELEAFYSVKAAFDGIRESIFSDGIGTVIYLLCAGIILAVVIGKLLRGHSSRQCLMDSTPFLLLAVIPLLWFVITNQPVAIHAFFQYRSIALTHWASGVFLYYLLPSDSKGLTNTN